MRARGLPDVAATSLVTLVQMVAQGEGLTFLPAGAAGLAEATEDVRVAQLEGHAHGRTVGLVWRATSARSEAWAQVAQVMRTARPPGTTVARRASARS